MEYGLLAIVITIICYSGYGVYTFMERDPGIAIGWGVVFCFCLFIVLCVLDTK